MKFKFWKWLLELISSKLIDTEKVEFLANELVKELDIPVSLNCENVEIWIHNKEKLEIETRNLQGGYSRTILKYTGK